MKKVNITMKKSFFVMATIAANFIFGQVGINNSDPKATLDVTAKTTDGTKPEGIIAPRLTGAQIQSGDAQYTALQTGTIVYSTSASPGAATTGEKTININGAGYYYFDGTIWQKFNSGTAAAAGTEPWYDVVSQTGATTNLQDIYQMGKVGVGFKTPLYNFEIGDNLNNGSYLSLSQSGANANGQSSLTYFTKRDNSNSITNATSKGWKWFALSDTYTLNPALANSLFLEGWNNGVRTQNVMTANPNGNVGFGIQIPTAKVHINASAIGTGFRLVDGSEGAGKVLVSDANGKASWNANSNTFVGFSVYYNGPSVNVLGYSKFHFNTTEYMTSGSFSGDEWTVTESGFYYVVARVWVTVSVGQAENTAIAINGNLYRFGTRGDDSPSVNSIIHLNAGDKLSILAQFGSIENPGPQNTYFSAYKVGN